MMKANIGKAFMECDHMKKHIKKSYLFIVGILVVMICSIGGYYVWCAYHPVINIRISEGSSIAENLKLDTPAISIAGKWYADPASAIMHDVNDLIMQHENVIQQVKDGYKESNISLDIKEVNGKTVLNYNGTAITNDNKKVEYHKEIILDFSLDATIYPS